MSSYPVKTGKREGRIVSKARNDIVRRDSATNEIVERIPSAGSFFQFRYSSMEISVRGDKAHVRARHARFEDGKLSTEAFDGDVGRSVYDQLVSNAHSYFVGQTSLFLNSLAALLPFSRRPPPTRD